MELPKRSLQGQVAQENSESLTSDKNPAMTPTGPALKFGLVDGKQGSVKKLGMAQTDYTDAHAGASPPLNGPNA